MATPDGLFELEGRPTAQLIADHLREQIIQGIYRPGQQINESVLAGQLSTSRGPVREALQRLTQEGLLVSLRNRGVFVTELSIDDIREIYAVREAVEKASAEILLNAGQSQIDRTCQSLKEIITEMAKQESSDWQAISRLDMQFHTSFVAGTDNSRLMRIYDTLVAETSMCIHNLRVSYPQADVLVREHREILDMLELRDNQGLQRAISNHMRKAVDDLTATTQPDRGDRVECL
jgi:DNA-binding GntR family transcriptional regulator